MLGSGIVDYFLEREFNANAKLTDSLYEYCAGALWGGFCVPRTRMSAVYQIIIAFILMVVTASYTANLAAFFTARSLPTLIAGSISDIETQGRSLCVLGNAFTDRFLVTYPQMIYNQVSSQSEAASLLASGTCDAMITTKSNYDTWRTVPEYCQFRLAQTLFPSFGGWLTNHKSPCVGLAMDYGLTILSNNGTIDSLVRLHFPQAPCSLGSAITSGRRLASDSDAESDGVFATADAGGSLRSWLSYGDSSGITAGRQLQGGARGGAGGDSGATAIEEPETNSQTMRISDFAGVLVLWVGATIAMINTMWVQRCYLNKPIVPCTGPGVKSLSRGIGSLCHISRDTTEVDDAAEGIAPPIQNTHQARSRISFRSMRKSAHEDVKQSKSAVQVGGNMPTPSVLSRRPNLGRSTRAILHAVNDEATANNTVARMEVLVSRMEQACQANSDSAGNLKDVLELKAQQVASVDLSVKGNERQKGAQREILPGGGSRCISTSTPCGRRGADAPPDAPSRAEVQESLAKALSLVRSPSFPSQITSPDLSRPPLTSQVKSAASMEGQ